MAPLALGTDAPAVTARRPPAHVGIVGFKPSHGAVANVSSFSSVAADVDTIAPIRRDVADVRALFNVIAVVDPRDPYSAALATPERQSPKDLRIAFSPRLGLDAAVDPDVEQAVAGSIERLRNAEWPILEADPRWPSGATEAAIMPIERAGIAALFGDHWRRNQTLFDPDIGRQIENGLSLPAIAVAQGRFVSGSIARAFAAFFCDWDLLISPTTACVAWPIEQLAPMQSVANLPRTEGMRSSPLS
jgi:aspartyl-tRNA(Asn)/glutamyl-tRNA(Gln) amidotransferase subunit A